MVTLLIIFLICFLASIIGAICGIGGGVIIKPLLDSFNIMSIKEASFLSGLTVLSMSLYSTINSIIKKDKGLNMKTSIPLGIGAAIGGIVGKLIFSLISSNANETAIIQSSILGVLVLLIFVYTILKNKIHTYKINNLFIFIVIGLLLGMMSSFLGIGGGPINLVIFSFFFSMSMKESAKNSLCVIVISQTTSLLYSLISGTVPEFNWLTLIVMVVGGILGGVIGRLIDKKISEKATSILFLCLNIVIALICIYNVIQYANI